MPIVLKDFQRQVCGGILAHFASVRALYADADHAEAQARATLRAQAPNVDVFDLEADRRLDAVRGGGVFACTWGSVAAANAQARRARTRSDSGAALDDLIVQAREAGLRIGAVVDEAHHGFHRARQARALFSEVLAPDYALMMTATPRDRDVDAFAADTGYRVGRPGDWASVSRHDAVAAGLLKRGVRTVRFIAKDDDARQLVDFEQLALRECAEAHRRIKDLLAAAGVALTPLMLVQVPDGRAAQLKAAEYLTGTLGFPAAAVRVHTADEPDPDLIALANDPSVEVLIFKMTVALGFDAPRAFTLAALRGARDADFGVQVIGRIVRVHALLQGRAGLPEALDQGYVFLANAESQEGLMDAGAQINALTTQVPELGTQSVFTVSGAHAGVQLVATGAPLALLLDVDGEPRVEPVTGASTPIPDADATQCESRLRHLQPAAESLFGALVPAEPSRPAALAPGSTAQLLLGSRAPAFVHRLRLLDRFAHAIEASGAPVPTADEMEEQLDLVLVRNPRLLRDARKRVRHTELRIITVNLPQEFSSDLPLDRAQRNAYGVFPPDLNPDERRMADVLDGHALVRWWHRNPSRKPGVSVALYGWDDGDGFFPDFVVGMDQREAPGGIALLEVKGQQLLAVDKEPAKAEAVHPDYGRVFMAGRRRGETEFMMLHKDGDKLDSDGPFALERLRWV